MDEGTRTHITREDIIAENEAARRRNHKRTIALYATVPQEREEWPA